MITVEEMKQNPKIVDAALELVQYFYNFNDYGNMTRCVGHLMNDIIYLLTNMKDEDVQAFFFKESGCYVDFLFDAAVKIDEAYAESLEEGGKV